MKSIKQSILFLFQYLKRIFVKPKKNKQEEDFLEKLTKFDGSYAQNKDNWVQYKNRKEKVKLRAIIRDAAIKLSKFNDNNYNQNRDLLISAYNVGGLDSVAKCVKAELDQIIENKNKRIQDVKSQYTFD